MSIKEIHFDLTDLTLESLKPQEGFKCVVRLSTSVWSDNRGIHSKRSILYLKKKCVGFNIVKEDVSNIGADFVLKNITNIDECVDGIYQVITCDEQRDFETGYVEDYNYYLIPYEEVCQKCNETKMTYSEPTEDMEEWGDAWVYCNQHRRVHKTGWCTVKPGNKICICSGNKSEEHAEKLFTHFKESIED